MVSEGPGAPAGKRSEDERELPQFALVRVQQHTDNHALAPGAEGGATLCDLGEPDDGWFLVGFSNRLYRIDCHACRERAVAALAALSEQANASREPEGD
jgi:hypothetical protein